MVEQMVSSNLSKYGLGKCASIITTATATTTAATATSEVKDVQKDDKPPKSLEEDQPKSPTAGSTSGNVNRNLVYARRKSDAELTNSDKNRTLKENFENEQTLATMEHWKARFSQLHNYLHQCDTSNQEVYLQKLGSFSPDECSRHAVELERRAIQLSMQEGTEMQRVKELNVLLQFGH